MQQTCMRRMVACWASTVALSSALAALTLASCCCNASTSRTPAAANPPPADVPRAERGAVSGARSSAWLGLLLCCSSTDASAASSRGPRRPVSS